MAGMSPLAVRSLSALVLAPPVLAALYFGPPFSDLLAILCGALMTWEWAGLCSQGRHDTPSILAIGTGVLVPALAALGLWELAAFMLLLGAVVAFVLARPAARERAAWLAFGTLYVGLFCLAFLKIRLFGWEPVLWLLFVVWATDTGAYFAGRGIGGPKLAPKISPNKTWAGLIGGMLCAGAVAALLGLWLTQIQTSAWSLLLAMLLAVVAQMGDLLESFLKRRYDAKDSSNLIPGHGGVLDRADGLMAASLLLAGMMLITRGSIG